MAAAKAKDGGTRQHYDYATTGTVPGVGSIGGASTAKGQAYRKGGKARKPHGRAR